MVNISKSKYTSFVTCPKQLWLNAFKPELAQEIDISLEQRFEQGNEAGKYAHGLFDGTVDVMTSKPDGKPDISAMILKTDKLIKADCPAIAEAAFGGEGFYAAVDILKNNGDGTWDIYEVKSATKRKMIFLYDIAFQYHVLTECGIRVRDCHLAYINNQYVLSSGIKPQELFVIEKVTGLLPEFIKDVPCQLRAAQAILSKQNEPPIDINESCDDPYKCAFYKYCSRHIPPNSVFDLYRLSKGKKFEYYRDGIISFDDIRKSNMVINEKQQRQVDFELDNKPPHIDRPAIKEFLDQIQFPIYFLDFETYQSCLPLFDGLWPYQQVPFQYSLHILNENGELEHKEFLADENKNEWRTLAEKLVNDIPMDGGTVISYNSAFENTRLKEMAEAFPDIADCLNSIIIRMADLIDVFRGGFYYDKAMGGSFSIKKVLPAICPDTPALDYNVLDDVHNGGEAMSMFLQLSKMPKTQRDKIRQSLLAYCRLDTLAMVEIYKVLVLLAANGGK